MQDSSYWIVALIVALGGIGLSLYYQGLYMLKPQEKKKIGKYLLYLRQTIASINCFGYNILGYITCPQGIITKY